MAKVCVVGADDGVDYARMLNRLNALAGVYDVDADKAREFGMRYNLSYYTSLQDMLASIRPDGVVVATPMHTHLGVISTIIEYCKNIFVVRPLGGSFKECKEITDVVGKNNAMLIPGYLDRFNPIINRTREIITSNRYGKILMLELQSGYTNSSDRNSGSMVYDTVIDDIDAALYLLDAHPDVVFAINGINGMTMAITLGFREEMIACITSTRVNRCRSITMIMEKGIVRCHPTMQEVRVEGKDVIRESADPLALALNNFIDVIKGKDKPRISAMDALAIERVADAVLLSSKLGSQMYISYE